MFAAKVVAVFGYRVTLEDVVRGFAEAKIPGYAVAGLGYDEQYGVEPIVKFTSIRPDAAKDADQFINVAARIGARFGEREVLVSIEGSADASMLVNTDESKRDRRGWLEAKHPLHDSFPVCPDCGERHPPKEQLLSSLPGGSNPLITLLQQLGRAGAPVDERSDDPLGVPFGLPDKKRREDN